MVLRWGLPLLVRWWVGWGPRMEEVLLLCWHRVWPSRRDGTQKLPKPVSIRPCQEYRPLAWKPSTQHDQRARCNHVPQGSRETHPDQLVVL